MPSLTKEEAMKLIESGKMDWEFAKNHIANGIFNIEETFKILKIYNFNIAYFRKDQIL